MLKISSESTKRIKKIKNKHSRVLRRYFSLLYPNDYVEKMIPGEVK